MTRLISTVLLHILCMHAWAGLRIEIVEVPPLLLTDKPVYLASSLNNWNPGDPNYVLQKSIDGHYYIDLPVTYAFEYKFTQGSWTTVEGREDGLPIVNRRYDPAQEDNPEHIKVRIKGWESKRAYTFIVRSLPESSPHDMSLFVTGNFNDWNAADPQAQLYRSIDGTWRATIYTDLPKIDYKFTRGNWKSVEGKPSGKARSNRVVHRPVEASEQIIDVQIEGWEDMSGVFHFFSVYDLLLLFSAFQGLLLIIAIPGIQNYNRNANRWLVITIGIASVMIFLRLLGGFRDVTLPFTKILLLPDFILFLYAPLFYLYLQKLLFSSGFHFNRRIVYLFIPLIVQIVVYLPLFLSDNRSLQLQLMSLDWKIQLLFVSTGFLALIWNIYYWFLFRRMLRFYSIEYQSNFSYEQNLNYLNTVLFIQAICLGVWLVTYVLIGLWRVFDLDVLVVIERCVDVIWLAFSAITYFVGYYAIHQPEIFKVSPQTFSVFKEPVPEEPLADEETGKADLPGNEELEQLKEKIHAFMLKARPYTNPRLSLNELAGKLKLPPHTLSKAINDGFEKNFFDFINTYRIEEFKSRVEDPKNRHFTLLALAYDVGFNSKTAFNRSFKKITGVTPSEYFQGIQMTE